MTTTYDPHDPRYLDEGDLRDELTRVYDLCHGCRLCWNLCPSFSTLFDLIDARDGDVAGLSHDEQDRVVDECYQCKLCQLKCPYVPPHEWALDFPRLMLRAAAAERAKSRIDVDGQLMGRTDLTGRVASAMAARTPLVNRVLTTPGTPIRRVMEKLGGLAAERVLPPYAKQRFSTWWKTRAERRAAGANGRVALFPTCLVEYQSPGIGRDVVKVYEHNDISIDVPAGTVCCGMPWLDSGDVEPFLEQGRRNVEVLARAVRAGRDVVVPQPTCGYVLKREYPDYLQSADARLVAEHTYDAAEYLVDVHRRGGLDTAFPGKVPETVTWHAPCHLRAQNIGFRSRDLMALTGAQVTVVDRCSGIDGTWGYRAENYELARRVAQPLKQAIDDAGGDVVAGDCHLANGAIFEETGRRPVHPVQVIARAYGIPDEEE
ncbi:MAG TPA: heterodisulfide reductase-related iron-sulfur binding cluster [Acidimicrobiales bacterium]|jgi:Fe-S oxidoreductase|nr:heterodisulfide reductase-related iron-sulfur binding cluster [Acidimicrobiales bacterium]